MNESTVMKILGAVNYEPPSHLVVQHVVALARRQQAAEAHFLHVSSAAPEDVGAGARRTALLLEWLGQALRTVADVPPNLRVIGHEAHGDPASLIVHTAQLLSVELVVVGTRDRRGVERLMGSVAESVMRHAERPVLVVRPKADDLAGAQIEPACPRCVEARRGSGGAELWCDQHRQKHGRRHTYYDNRAQSWSTQPWFLEGGADQRM